MVQFCSLCGSDRNKLFNRCRFRDREVFNRICLNCGLVFQSPCMDEAEAAAFYATEYRLLNEGSIDPTARNMSVQRARAESLAAFTHPFIHQLVNHLDIGCSIGILLKRFEKTYRCQPVGIEPGDAHRMDALKEGLTVCATLEELELVSKARFDLISMSHILEHLSDPVGYLTHLRECLLVPNGWLLLEVPNLYAHDSFELAHLYSFSPHTLHEVLRRSGFAIIKFEQHGRPNSQIIPLYLTALCQPVLHPDPSPVRPERGVTYKRHAGMVKRRILTILFPKRAWLMQG
jgi:SAM-dependent methyltransferase